MGEIIDIKQKKKINTASKKPEWTPEEIKAKIQPYADYLNQPNKVY